MHNPLKFTDPSGYYPKELGNHPTPAFSGYNLDQLILSEGGFGGGGSGSYYYTKIFGRGDITYNWYSGNYQYDNGEIATYDQAMNQLYSNTRSNDISTISGSSLFGYDHLYSLSINGQLRLAGSIGGEITGLAGGHFVVTNNAFSAVLAANGEVTVWGGGTWIKDTMKGVGFVQGFAGVANDARMFLEMTYVNELRLDRARSGNFSKPINHKLSSIKNAGKVLNRIGGTLLLADIAMSGEMKPSHWINSTAILSAGTGIGAFLGGAWFVADYGTMGVNYLLGNGTVGLGDIIDNSNWGKSKTIEMYEGLY